MYPFSAFNPQAATSWPIDTKGINRHAQLMVYNDSPVGFKLLFKDNTTDVIPAYWNKSFRKDEPMGIVQCTAIYTLANPSQYPISICYGTLYEEDERVADANTSMNRGIVVTNTVETNSTIIGGGTTDNNPTIINDGLVGVQPILESTHIGSSASNFYVDNSGNMTVAEYVSGIFKVLFKTLSNTVNAVLIGATGKLVEVLGSMKVDNNLNVIGRSYLDNGLISTSGTGGLTCVSYNGNIVTSNPVTVTRATLSTGSISRINQCSYRTTASIKTATVSHGLGVTPDFVIIIPNSVDVYSCLASNFTSTTFIVTSSASWFYFNSWAIAL